MNGDYQILINKVDFKPWESAHFGYQVSQIYPELDIKRKRFEYVLVNADNVNLIKTLEEDEFRYLMAVVDLSLPEDYITPEWVMSYPEIREALAIDLDQLMDLAETSFNKTRLHSSTDFKTADIMHGDWIRNCLNKTQADHVYVYIKDNNIVGFIATRIRDKIGEIVLIAVDKSVRGKGIGTQLVDYACTSMEGKVESIKVRTELANLSSLRMYAKSGFKITGSSIYMGKWYD